MLILLALACTAPSPDDTDAAIDSDTYTDSETTHEPVTVRFATFNTSLYRSSAGQLAADLANPSLPQATDIASIVDSVDPDVILLNEVDVDLSGAAVDLLQGFFAAPYPHVYIAPSNTGVPSGFDLDNNGSVSGPEDAFGYGEFEGQYGFVVLSRYALGTPRSYQNFLWKDLPNAWLPDAWFSPEELDVVRLSSKNHVDIPITIEGTTIHFLASHPTPPTFDGPEDRNGRRNHDEIAFWTQYLDADGSGWPVDDAGNRGGLDGGSFVIAGDLNADPRDGDSSDLPMLDLFAHPRVQDPAPTSLGGTEQADLQGGMNDSHISDPASDTADFNDFSVGNLRLDYVLPSVDLPVLDSGVFWPESTDPEFGWVRVSDHRLVWVDVQVESTP